MGAPGPPGPRGLNEEQSKFLGETCQREPTAPRAAVGAVVCLRAWWAKGGALAGGRRDMLTARPLPSGTRGLLPWPPLKVRASLFRHSRGVGTHFHLLVGSSQNLSDLVVQSLKPRHEQALLRGCQGRLLSCLAQSLPLLSHSTVCLQTSLSLYGHQSLVWRLTQIQCDLI